MTGPLPSPQAPGEAEPEAAADLIDMGPDPAANGSLSSQLAGMSKCGVGGVGPWCPCSSGGPSPYTARARGPQQNVSPDPASPGSQAASCYKAEQQGQSMGDPPS